MKDEQEEDKSTQGEASVQEKILERGGQNLLFVVICFLLVGFAVPLLLVFLIKSPQPEEHIFILGVSYYKLVFIFFVSAAVMVHASLFFLRAGGMMIFLTFILSLFCCFPFIVGLRNSLTLRQVIVDVPFFSSWPFFLKPAYILIEFLVPAGVLVYLFLQTKSIFSRKPHTYAFLCTAVYLAIAAALGFSALIQIDEPNIVTALARRKVDPVQNGVAGVLPDMSPQDFPSGEDNIGMSRFSTLPIVEVPKHQGPESAVSETRLSAATEGPNSDETAIAELDHKMQLLSDRADRIIVELSQMRKLFTEPREKQQEEKTNQTLPLERGGRDGGGNTKAIAELQQEVRQLSGKVDHILEALNQMANVLPERQDDSQVDEAIAAEKEKPIPNTEVSDNHAPSQVEKPQNTKDLEHK